MRTLHIYSDELGDTGPFDLHSPIYSLSLLFLDEQANRNKNLSALKKIIRKKGQNHFVHCGNLIRGEWPYGDMLREDRQELFYALVSYAGGIDFRFKVARVRKEELVPPLTLENELFKQVARILNDNLALFSKYDIVIVHYDGGQKICTKVLKEAISSYFGEIVFQRTAQREDVFMQVADLLCVLDSLDYKLIHGGLTHSEEKFLGKRGKIKKELLGRFKNKGL